MHIDKTTFVTPSPQFNVVNSAGKTFSNLPRHKLSIELGELGLKKRHMIQHGIYHKEYAYFVQRERKSQPVMSKIYGLVMVIAAIN